METRDLKRLIEALDQRVGVAMSARRANWAEIWAEIKIIGQAFRETSFPDRADRAATWTRFQALVGHVQEQREETQARFSTRAEKSPGHLDRIRRLIWAGTPVTDLENGIFALAASGTSIPLGDLLNIDETRLDLERCGKCLKDAGEYLRDHKDEMIPPHKNEAFEAIKDAREKLDAAWAAYKTERHREWEGRQERKRTWEEKSRLWRAGQEAYAERLVGVRDHKEGQISRALQHIHDLEGKRSDSSSDKYRDRVTGWIDQERERVAVLRDAVESINRQLSDIRAALRT